MRGKAVRHTFISVLDDIVMIFLALLSAVLLFFEATRDLTPEQLQLIYNVDFTIALIFLGEWIIKFYLADNRRKHFNRTWWLLLACIPITTDVTQTMRALRFLRILRLLRLLRVVHGTVVLLKYCERFFERTHVAYIFIIFGLTAFAGATAFYILEHGSNEGVQSYLDSLWWALGAETLAGYADITPVTEGGRVLSVILTMIGIGLYGTFTAMVETFLLRTHPKYY